nr:odorant receptor 11 [Pachyrhinus yasumatsui]
MRILELNIKVLKCLSFWPFDSLTDFQNMIVRNLYFFISLVTDIFSATSMVYQITVGVEDVYILSESFIHTIDFVGYVVVCQHYHRNHHTIRSLIADFEIFETFCEENVIEKVNKKVTQYTKCLLTYVLPGLAFNSVWPLFTKNSCLKTAAEYYKKHDPCGMPTHNWYPFDASNPAFYWIAYFIEANVINSAVLGFVFGPVLVGGLLMHIIAQLKNCKRIFAETVKNNNNFEYWDQEIVKKNLKFCIRYHQTILEYAKVVFKVFGHMLIVYMTMASFTMAAITYQVTILEQNVQDRLRYFMLLLGWIILFFMICYGGQRITDESLDVSHAIYKSNWYNLPVNLRKYILIMIMRAQKPLHLRADYVGFFSLPLFIHVLKTAYSAFSLLLTITNGD